NSTIANNSARSGAGLRAVNSHVAITNCTIANNHGTGTFGGSCIEVLSDLAAPGDFSLESSTLSGNTSVWASQAADIYVETATGSTQSIILHNTILNGAASN